MKIMMGDDWCRIGWGHIVSGLQCVIHKLLIQLTLKSVTVIVFKKLRLERNRNRIKKRRFFF